jgi:hypothetical protein
LASEKLLCEVGNRNGYQSPHHPLEQVEVSLDGGKLYLQIFFCHQLRLVNGKYALHLSALGLLLIEAGLLKLANKFMGIEGNRGHC